MAQEKFAHYMFSTMSKDHLSHSQNTTTFRVPYDLRCWILRTGMFLNHVMLHIIIQMKTNVKYLDLKCLVMIIFRVS